MIYKVLCTKCNHTEECEHDSLQELVSKHSHVCTHCNTEFNYIAIQGEGELRLKGSINA